MPAVQTILTAIHLFLLGVAGMGPILAALIGWFARPPQDTAARLVVRRLNRFALISLVGGVVLGFVLWAALAHAAEGSSTAFVGNEVNALFGERWFSITYLLVFSLVCLGIVLAMGPSPRRSWLARLLGVVAGTNLVYHFPLLFVMASLLAARPELRGKTLDRSLYYQLLGEGELWGRVTHHWGALVLAAAVALLHLSWSFCRHAMKASSTRSNDAATDVAAAPDENGKAAQTRFVAREAFAAAGLAARWGARVASLAICVQIVTGLANLLLLPTARQIAYLGENPAATCWLLAGIFTALAVLPGLLELAFDAENALIQAPRRPLVTALVLCGVWVAMCAAQTCALQ